MQPDARRRADTLSWFEKAHKDLRCAQIELAADPPASEDALYHCQQAAAKALKGFLVRHDHILTIRGGILCSASGEAQGETGAGRERAGKKKRGSVGHAAAYSCRYRARSSLQII